MPPSCSIARLLRDVVKPAPDYVLVMDASEAEERVRRLLSSLDETTTLLEQHGESHWAQWMRAARTEVQAQDAHGLDRLLQAYGGMGSFNDVVLTHLNGHQIDSEEEPSVNARLDALKSLMYGDATALRHAVDD